MVLANESIFSRTSLDTRPQNLHTFSKVNPKYTQHACPVGQLKNQHQQQSLSKPTQPWRQTHNMLDHLPCRVNKVYMWYEGFIAMWGSPAGIIHNVLTCLVAGWGIPRTDRLVAGPASRGQERQNTLFYGSCEIN